MLDKVLLNVVEEPLNDSVSLYLVRKTESARYLGVPVEFREVEESAPYSGEHIPPTLSLPRHVLSQLMDSLWNIGIRPKNFGDAPGELRATKYHLEDMRRMVFDDHQDVGGSS